ncbi:MAG: hypothetical protein JM58_17425 [Peptococcaceae bacterium BICA1-8]|nr:MAG: hypothetical protein JM58_17425 [Peptococcaceae bacterium BICA1-8]
MSLSINLGRLRNDVGTTSNYELTAEKLELTDELEVTKPVRISLMVTNNGRILELKGYINTEIEVKCHRCLDPVIIPINTVIEEELVYFADLRYVGDFSKVEIEEKFLVFDNDIFDLTDIFREYIISALPYRILCSEECRGLCIKCGQNLNIKDCDCNTEEIDPRLVILAKLIGTEEV